MTVDFKGLVLELRSMLQCMYEGWIPTKKIWADLLGESAVALRSGGGTAAERQALTFTRHQLITIHNRFAA